MVQILHVHLKKIYQLISYVVSGEKKILYFFENGSKEKKNLTRGVQQSGY
jgi:hypothetical protein